MKWIIVAVVASAALAGLLLLWPGGGEETECYPPVETGQPESAQEHGLVSEECKSK